MKSSQIQFNEVQHRFVFLDSLKAFAIAMVVAIHAQGYVGLAQGKTEQMISFITSSIAVPIFFLVDGFLFSSKQVESTFNYKKYLLKSSRRLLLPWLIFSFIYTVTRAIFEALNFFPEKIIITASLIQIIKHTYLSTVASQMYFLPSLFMVRALSIVTRFIVTASTFTAIMVFGGYTFLFRIFFHDFYKSLFPMPDFDPVLHAFWGLQFYFLGIILYKLREQTIKFPLTIATFSFVILINAQWLIPAVSFLSQYSYLICAFFFILATTKEENMVSRIGTHTMGIYLLHAPVLLKCAQILTINIINDKFIALLVLWLITFLSSFWLARHIVFIPYGKLIFGETSK